MEVLRKDAGDQAGEILLGKIDRMMPGMDCCFVDIGRKRSGYLPLTEGSNSFTGERLRSGEQVIVQIRKEEFGEKGAFLTRDVTLAGRYVMLMPMNRHIGVSSRITEEKARERLKKLGRTLNRGERAAGEHQTPDETTTGGFGLVMRAAAVHAEEEDILEEVNRLWAEWQKVLHIFRTGKGPRILWTGDDSERQILNDYAGRGGVDRIWQGEALPAELERQWRNTGARRITLPHGGNIVIDRCEALTVIDVNTAGDTTGGRIKHAENGDGRTEDRSHRKKSAENTSAEGIFLETNLEACEEIVRQVRLRNLSGVILVDFINLMNEEDQSCLIEALRHEFEKDRVKTVIHGFTALGLVEMTRKRSHGDWYEHETECCPTCGGSGRIRRRKSE